MSVWREKDGALSGFAVGVMFLVGIAVLLVALWGVGLVVNRKSCRERAVQMERDYDWGIWSGCQVRADDGRFVPIDNFRVIEGP